MSVYFSTCARHFPLFFHVSTFQLSCLLVFFSRDFLTSLPFCFSNFPGSFLLFSFFACLGSFLLFNSPREFPTFPLTFFSKLSSCNTSTIKTYHNRERPSFQLFYFPTEFPTLLLFNFSREFPTFLLFSGSFQIFFFSYNISYISFTWLDASSRAIPEVTAGSSDLNASWYLETSSNVARWQDSPFRH